MAVAFDAGNGTFKSGSPSSPQTLALTCGASATILVVFVDVDSGGSTTGVTYNGVAMTQSGTGTTLNSREASTWYLLNPDTGSSFNVSAAYSGSPANLFIGAISFTGAGGVSGRATAEAVNNLITVDVSSNVGDMVCDSAVALGNDVITVGAGQTQRFDASPAFTGYGGSTEAGAATVTMSWSIAASEPWNQQAINVTATVVGGGGTINRGLGLLGLGQ